MAFTNESDSKTKKALDFSHHYADAFKKFGEFNPPNKFAGALNLDGGVPATGYFPIESITVEHLKHTAFPLEPTDTVPTSAGVFGWLASVFSGKSATTKNFTIPRYLGDASGTPGGKFELKSALTYSPSEGLAPLETFIREWSGVANQPLVEDWDTFVTIGAASSWSLVVRSLLNPGEGFLADAYAYNGALIQAAATYGRAVSVATDSQGLSAVDLENVLSTWDSESRGFPRPRLLYTQGGINNPSGQFIELQRKKEIYDVAVRYDLIIAEDDPYRWQESPSPYVPAGDVAARAAATKAAKAKTDEEWRNGVVPSFLTLDYQGRVIRIDTFSKTIGPGARLGYFTTSPSIKRVLQFVSGATAETPSGFSQAIVGQLLHNFGQDGFTRWLRGLASQYELRRNWSLDTLFENLRIEKSDSTASYVAFRKTTKSNASLEKTKSLFSFIPPVGGMFIWFAIHLQNHPSFEKLSSQSSAADAKTYLADKLWNDLGEAGVVFRQGELFAVPTPEERVVSGEEVIYLRAAYSYSDRDELERAFKIFATVVTAFFD